MTNSDNAVAFPWQAVATIVAAMVTFLIWFVSRRESSDLLRKSERLTEISSKMEPSAERTLVTDTRDHFVVEWILLRSAPAHFSLQVVRISLLVLGVVALILFTLLGILDRTQPIIWWFYVAALLLLAGAQVASLRRLNLRATWMKNERNIRWIRRREPGVSD